MNGEEIGLVIAIIFAVLVLTPAIVGCQEEEAERERLHLEELLYRNAREEAASRAARLVHDPGASTDLRRVGKYILCLVLHDRFRTSRADFHSKTEAARQAVRTFQAYLKESTGNRMDIKARFFLAVLLQDRARWLMEVNDVLHAVDISHDLEASSGGFRSVLNPPPPAARDTDEQRRLRLWARLRLDINIHLYARLYSPEDVRRPQFLNLALQKLFQFALDHGGTPAGNLAYFYYGRTWALRGDDGEARKVFLDLWKSVPWSERNAPLIEEVLWHLCCLDMRHDRTAAVVTGVALLKKRLRTSSRIPSRYAVLAMGEAVLALWKTHGPGVAADTLEADAAWLDRMGCPSAWIRFPAYAAKLAPRTRSTTTPTTHPPLMLLTAQGLLEAGRPDEALAWSARLTRTPVLPASIQDRAWRILSRAWEALGFLREAVFAVQRRTKILRSDPATARRLALLWKKIADRSASPGDREQYLRARAAAPRPPGRMEYEAGMRAYRTDALEEALQWLSRVEAGSLYHPLALAFHGYIRYLLLDPRAPDPGAQKEILNLLKALNHVKSSAPNWMPAQALRFLTQALVKKAMGDTPGALEDVSGFEERFRNQSPQVVAEALKVRLRLLLDQGCLDRAEKTLTHLQEQFPGRRATGEACLVLGRSLRKDARLDRDTDPPRISNTSRLRLERSIDLRRRAAVILKADFPSQDRYVLADDEMAVGRHHQALELLEVLWQGNPPELREHRRALELRRIRCLIELNRHLEAEQALRSCLKRKPDHLKPLKLLAVLLGGTIKRTPDGFEDRPHLDRAIEAQAIWERIKEYAEQSTPYPSLWFEAQMHLALLSYRAGKKHWVQRILRWIRVSGYEDLGGGGVAEKLQWLEGRIAPDRSKKRDDG